jgi:quercetin dioxygenase-like cupin family protein
MTSADDRLRPPPSAREAGPELNLDFGATLRALRAEPHPPTHGHRQISVAHRGPLRLVLFAFDQGGRLPEHRAPGLITILALRGRLRVRTPRATHELDAGQAVLLDPDIPHDVEAPVESDMLLAVHLNEPR